jgi:hypothetical protein
MKLLFLSILLVICLGCAHPANTPWEPEGSPEPCGPCPEPPSKPKPNSPTASWLGQPVGQLIASWGQPSHIIEVKEHEGYYDYIFRSTRRPPGFFRDDYYYYHPYFWTYGGFPYRLSPWGPWFMANFDSYSVTCQAEVRVAPDQTIGCVRFSNPFYCSRYSPFGPAPKNGGNK